MIRIWPLGGWWIVAAFVSYALATYLHFHEISHLFKVVPNLEAAFWKSAWAGVQLVAFCTLAGWLAGRTWDGEGRQ